MTMTAWEVEDVRGYGPAVVEKLQNALNMNPCVSPDPGHPHMLVVEADDENFYVAPLSAGKVMLLGYWKQ